MLVKIFVFANMGHLDQLPKSGGQSSARRVMKGLQESGFTVVPIRRHRAELEGKWKHQLEIMTFALIDLLKIVCKMLFCKREGAAFLHLTYAGPLVPYELLLTKIVEAMGYKSIIYFKGGQVLDYYRNGNDRHRKMFKKSLDLQSKVFFEGKESMMLAKSISSTPMAYFPNYVFDDQIPSELPEKTTDIIGLLYFGRIAPNKNIEIIVDTFELLCQKYDNLSLTLIGGAGQSKAYVDRIDYKIKGSPFSSKITRMGITPFDKIREIMQTQHFFIFPSKEKAEGHSNSLNEAMSQGLIPIVSDYHFNRSVVGDDRLVVDGTEALLFANKIDEIISKDNINQLSQQMWRRVKNNFAFSIVGNKIKLELVNLK
jgi:glycosyltransferase involved in cell wall biosynthesis